MARIGIGGWQHETNTFATIKAEYADFERADEWPGLSIGDALFENTAGVHLPVTGAIERLKYKHHDLVPLLWCAATPCAHVSEDAFEQIASQFLDLIAQALPLDGIYLDLHGAMVCEHLEDGEGEFLSRIRSVVGDEIPIVVSLDLHANVTPLMVRHATAMDIFRTYPHIDMGETGARAADLLDHLIASGTTLFSAFRQVDFIIALNCGCSLIEPCNSIYNSLQGYIGSDVQSVSFACGFHLSDIYDVGPAVLAYATTQRAADTIADRIIDLVQGKEATFYQKIWPVKQGVAEAIKHSDKSAGTVVIADTQDNPGGGGAGDTTGILQALIQAGATNAVFGALSDPETVSLATAAGIGVRFDALLGGKSGQAGQKPYPCQCTVLALADGNFIATGPMYKGAHMTLGPCALVETGGVKVVLVSKPVQAADQSIFRHLGVEPANTSIIALKSSVHFRNDFSGLGSAILLLAAPGTVVADPAELIYKNKRKSIRIL